MNFLNESNFNVKMPEYYCPYCYTDNVTVYNKYFKCNKCKLKFDKKNFELFEDKSNLLSLSELKGIAKVLKKSSAKK